MRKLIRRFPYKPQTPRIFLTLPKQSLRQKMWRWFKRTLMIFGGLSLISVLFTIVGVYQLNETKKAGSLPSEFVLTYKFTGTLPEAQQFTRFGLPISSPTFYEFFQAMESAKKDDRIKGFVAIIEDGGYALSQVQEIRQAVKELRSSGKFAYAISSGYGDFSNGMAEYYLASAFDEVWLQPVGNVSINGFMAEVPLVRGLLDKVGVRPEFYTREEFKSAMETFTNKEISPENKETLVSIFGVFSDQFLDDVSKDRGIEKADLLATINQSPLTAAQALSAQLVDTVDYADTLLERVKFEVAVDPEADLSFKDVFDYAARIEGDGSGASSMIQKAIGAKASDYKVAILNLSGMIVPGSARSSTLSVSNGSQVIYADDINPHIYKLAKDDSVKAILVRMDSPGGSPTASESIRRALSYARDRGKKIIVSMASVAASGGYWIASTADHIVANPTTITGSIGVVAGKIDASELLKKLDINVERITVGENADFWSSLKGYDQKGEEKINQLLDNIYNDFLARVSAGRGLDIDEVKDVAKGRAWSGQKAKEVALVDTLGGLKESLIQTAELIEAPGYESLDITLYPKPKSPLEVVLELVNGTGPEARVSGASAILNDIFQPIDNLYLQATHPEYFTTYLDYSLGVQ